MAVNPIPPQAYTKDTMLRAYSWLQNQSLHIREMATTPDILVSLYLKTTRDGEGALDRPSIQNFKNELRSLAGLMGELESVPTEPAKNQQALAASASPSQSQQPPPTTQQAPPPPPSAGSPPQRRIQEPFTRAEDLFFAEQPEVSSENTNPAGHSKSSGDPVLQSLLSSSDLDQKSLEMIREVKVQLNLSNETEALRAIVRLGHLQLTRLFRE